MGSCAFLGRTAGGESVYPVRLDSFESFRTRFGDDRGITSRAVRGFFENGGAHAVVVRVKPRDGAGLVPDDFVGAQGGAARGLRLLDGVEEADLIAVPDLVGCFRAEASFASLESILSVQRAVIDHCERRRDRFAILDAPGGLPLASLLRYRRQLHSSHAALYHPWLLPRVMEGVGPPQPPSGHVAGLYARSDAEGGVHRAPANLPLAGLVDVADAPLTRHERERLLAERVNVIQAFPSRGVRIWGARTLASTDPFTQVNVRRLFIMLRRSIETFSQWVAFEPNGEPLWKTLVRSVEAFLFEQLRKGALVGERPEDAYYVKCDEETNTPEAQSAGELVVEIGVAPVRPAEFIVVRIHQWTRDPASDTGKYSS